MNSKLSFADLPWAIVYRPESASPYAMRLHNRSGEGPHSSADDAVFTDILQGLEGGSRYVVCAALAIDEGSTQHFEMDPAACQSVNTKDPKLRSNAAVSRQVCKQQLSSILHSTPQIERMQRMNVYTMYFSVENYDIRNFTKHQIENVR